ncbi:ARM repeat-containing protein [Saccharata proteae CBS 121410]|uniref:ARM repeat-containing protein n=1 Tax=Saccharata proteae CBS 121410 TaxID=1314787 RepID=A0A9P4HYI5_9PEZI|nr:ARM repeat-containing protein [Saccharata proteae CBS 121410]
MQSNVDRAQKGQAHEYLEQFQKSEQAWETNFTILQSADTAVEAKLFAATTLKGKIVYDLYQLPRDALSPLRDTLLARLGDFRVGPKPIRLQLCVCLANLAIQMTEWKDVLPLVVSTLGSNPESIPCVLDFLRVLPEEVTEGRKINLTEDELTDRTKELLENNAQAVLALLAQYANSSAAASKNPQLMDCLNSWAREVPINDIVNSSLLATIMNALNTEESFESAVECICAIIRETRDVDECMNVIQTLYPQIATLRSKLAQAAEEEDTEVFKGISRILAEAGEAWVLLVARMPEQFRDLVQSILQIAALDKERDAMTHTFPFWYELKQYLTLDKYIEARLQYVDIYSGLVDVMIGHLEYPKPESGDEKDLFEGDREQEEKFREFRHQMGDVLKDCCQVIGVTDCLQKSYELIKKWVATYGPQASSGHVPEWQKLEAPLFSMRAMGRQVPPDEGIMLPQLMPLLVQIPDQEKVRFQAVMALGRYTAWTAQHPETLQPQLDYIMAAFQHPSKEVVRAAALSFKFFCNDCATLLKDFIPQLQQFYASVLDQLPESSQEEITDGVASVLAEQPAEKTYEYLKLFCHPIIERLMNMAASATDDRSKLLLADKLQLLTIFIQWVQPRVPQGQPNPAVSYCQEIFPVLAGLAEKFVAFNPVLERICRCWRYMVMSYRADIRPLIPQLAHQLVTGFSTSRQGCFLWATGSIVREFAEDFNGVDAGTSADVYRFYEQQATIFLTVLSASPPEDIPDTIEDFFRLSDEVVLFYPSHAVSSPLMGPILEAATAALTLLQEPPLLASLHFLRGFLAYGNEYPPTSEYGEEHRTNPPEIQAAVKQLVATKGEELVRRIMAGMMYSFPRECFPDASGVLLEMFNLLPRQVADWVKLTVTMLPPGSISPQEAERLINNINQRIQSNEIRKIRTILQDFTNSYRRRNVAPREGLGRLEATRFRFNG